MDEKKAIWGKIKNLDFGITVSNELFAMVEENLHRVEFVKDHVGIRDFLFLAEKGTEYVADFFVAINVGCERSYTYKKNLDLFLQKYNDKPIEALAELADFFVNTERTLYIGIGFKNTEGIKEEDIIDKLLNNKYKTQEEILKDIRKFPDWYDEISKYPEDIKFLTVKTEKYIKEVLKPLENTALRKQLDGILEKDDLSNNDKKLLKELAYHLQN